MRERERQRERGDYIPPTVDKGNVPYAAYGLNVKTGSGFGMSFGARPWRDDKPSDGRGKHVVQVHREAARREREQELQRMRMKYFKERQEQKERKIRELQLARQQVQEMSHRGVGGHFNYVNDRNVSAYRENSHYPNPINDYQQQQRKYTHKAQQPSHHSRGLPALHNYQNYNARGNNRRNGMGSKKKPKQKSRYSHGRGQRYGRGGGDRMPAVPLSDVGQALYRALNR